MSAATGVYYRHEDYATFWRRLFIDLADTVVVAVIWLVVAIVVRRYVTMSLVVISYCYFVLLKRSGFGTIGYRLGSVKVVGMDGRHAGIFSLTVRFLFMCLGPLNYVIDLIWLTSDSQRQALRDKFTQTYVIKKNASPAGEGEIVLRYYDICGWNLMFREIEPQANAKSRGA